MNRHTSFVIIFMLWLLIPLASYSGEPMKHSYIPQQGFVPDEKTASAIAEAVLIPIYGEEKVNAQKPFVVSYSENIWIVQGTLKKIMLGGVFRIEISKNTAEILSVTHGK